MPADIAHLRAVNVMGGGKLPMAGLCEPAGLEQVRTCIAPGNALFRSRPGQRRIKALLEERLATYAGEPVGVMVRTADEMTAVPAASPVRDESAQRTVAIFLDHPPPADAITTARGRRSQSLAPRGGRGKSTSRTGTGSRARSRSSPRPRRKACAP
jgi:uncharacterized protein (DUF1697 family)